MSDLVEIPNCCFFLMHRFKYKHMNILGVNTDISSLIIHEIIINRAPECEERNEWLLNGK